MSVMAPSSHQQASHTGQQPPRTWDPSTTPRFQTLKFLGKGGQGFVQLAFDNLHKQRVAIKYIDRGWSRGFYKYVLRETLHHQQLSLCKHPHIVEFHEVFLTPSYLAVVMEYVNGTNLQHYLEAAGGQLPEDVARFIFQQLIIAVDFCHRKGKVNRDIKLANILLQEGHLPLVKLCDFGFSKDKFDDSEPQTQIGTALFTAPEIFTNVPGQVYDAEAADVWSCGVVLFVMLFGCHPFLSMEDTQHRKHAQVMKLIENAVRGNVQVPPGAEELYPQALDLVGRILVSAPGQRSKLPAIMSHAWFQDKLPPGALLLNAAYLAMDHPVGELRQTPEEVHAIITAALSVSGQEEKSEANSAGPTIDMPTVSEVSRSYPGQSQLQPQTSTQSQQQPVPGPGPSAQPQAMMVVGGAAGPPGSQQSAGHHLQSPMVPGAGAGNVPTQPQSGLGGFMAPVQALQPPGPPQTLSPLQVPPQAQNPHAHPHSHLQSIGSLAGRAPQPCGLHLLGMELGGQQPQPGSTQASGSSHSPAAVATGSGSIVHAVQSVAAGGAGAGSGAMPPHTGPHGGPPALQHVMAPDPSAPQVFQHPSPALSQATGQQPLAPPGSPMPAGSMDTLGAKSSANVNVGVTAGLGAPGLMANPGETLDVVEDAAAVAAQCGTAPSAMEVSGCILYDSSLLYKLDLQTED